MLFNSLDFAVFLPLVFILYWFITNKSLKAQNLLILIASYVFYGWWDWKFLSLIVISTLVDYYVGLYLAKEESAKKRKQLLWISMLVNLGFLGFFKYYNFFIESFATAFSFFGEEIKPHTLNIILPVGISFYTFQTMSYTIDVYRKKLSPTKNIIEFAAFVTFFPQLVAGPIERATNLLPQFQQKRIFNHQEAISGIHLILWGLFKKIVIADTCATYVNSIFNNYESMNTLSLVLGSIYFAFQIYGDFSGYSDIAIGTSRLFGFSLMKNFNYPYFSRDIAEFWRRWHISLSTWFRDYLYIPLGGSRGTKFQQIRNVFIIFIVSGFWHGANWTFIIWGVLNACYFLPLLLLNKNRNNTGEIAINSVYNFFSTTFSILTTFLLTCLAWIFFRAENVTHAWKYLLSMINNWAFNIQYLNIDRHAVEPLVLIAFFIFIEWFYKTKESPISGKFSWLKAALIILAIITLGAFSSASDFIYFQF